jgi:endonuclease III
MRLFNIRDDQLNYQFDYNNNETDELNKSINHNQEITINDLRRIALWKLDRILNVPDELIQRLQDMVRISDINIDDIKVKELIEDLLDCPGIGMPMASSILKFLRPDVFPIIDVRAYRALYGSKLYYGSYNYARYREYVVKIYEIRDSLGINLSEVDQQLYCFDKNYNGKI